MGDAGGELPDGFKLLRLPKLNLHRLALAFGLMPFGNIVSEPDDFGQAASFIELGHGIPTDNTFLFLPGGQYHFEIMDRPLFQVAKESMDLLIISPGIQQLPPMLADHFLRSITRAIGNGRVHECGATVRGNAHDEVRDLLDEPVDVVALLAQIRFGLLAFQELPDAAANDRKGLAQLPVAFTDFVRQEFHYPENPSARADRKGERSVDSIFQSAAARPKGWIIRQ